MRLPSSRAAELNTENQVRTPSPYFSLVCCLQMEELEAKGDKVAKEEAKRHRNGLSKLK